MTGTLSPAGTARADETMSRIRRHLSPRLALTSLFAGQGAIEVSAGGARVQLSDGREMLDFGSYAVALLGHRNAAVADAVRQQLDVMPTSTRTLANPVTAAAAATLAEYFGGGLPRVHFGLNGSDVVEVAIKLARVATGRTRIIAVEGGFHGKSLGALALTHSPHFRAGLEGSLADTVHVAADDPGAVDREMRRSEVAAVVFEPVQGENGAVVLDPEVLRAWSDSAAAHGAFVIADEIQCGLRRCGDRSVALSAGLPVDAVLVGKPLGGGIVPLSAGLFSELLYQPLAGNPFLHSATFGGHPLSCAALPAALGEIERLAPRGEAISAALGPGLAELRQAHPAAITSVHGRGLLWGLDLTSAAVAGEMLIGLAGAGLLVSPCLSRPSTLRLLAPLVATDADVTEALTILDSTLGAATAAVGGVR